MERTVIGNLELVFGRKAVFFMGYGCLGTGNVEKNGKIADFPGEKSRGKFHGCSERRDSIGARMNSPLSWKFHGRSEQRDRMEMLRIFQVAAVFFGILMEKISRVQAAGRKMIGRRPAWYAAAGADWSCGTGYGSVRNAVDAGTGTSAGASAVVAIDERACRKRWGHARRGRKNVIDKVDVGNNPRDGNVCWEHRAVIEIPRTWSFPSPGGSELRGYIYKYISSGM